MGGAADESVAATRFFGASTDDTAIYLEDTMDEPTARCISCSSSVVAILSPQRLPPRDAADITAYDAAHIGAGRSSGEMGKRAARLLSDLTNTSAAAAAALSKSPNPRRAVSTSAAQAKRKSHSASQQRAVSDSIERQSGECHASSQFVPLAKYQELERERNRYSKMYEHQKTLYEDIAARQADTHKSLQEKIIDVVALSTRNEENKRFIRQLKREMADSRSRVMAFQNRALEESRQEKLACERYEALLQEQKELYTSKLEKQEAKTAGLESLLNDITFIRGESDKVQIFQLNALLKASYAKNTALFEDILRQGQQISMLFDSKANAERQVDQLRNERREMEAQCAEERRRMTNETERYASQIAEQQSSILELRQMLIRALDASNARAAQDGGDETLSNCSSSYSSSEESEEVSDEGEAMESNDNVLWGNSSNSNSRKQMQ